MARRFDAIIIGAGQAGPALAARLDAAGRSVALVERARLGGTCVNTGCIPTKALIGSARIAHHARRAGDFGLRLEGAVRADMAAVKARVDGIVEESRRGLADWLGSLERVTLLRGHARLRGQGRVEVDGETLEAGQIFLNTGARARVPDLPGLDGVDFLTNSGLLALDTLPEHLIVVGGGAVGLELAQAYRRLGSEVTVVEMKDRLVSREDGDVSEALAEILRGEGLHLRLGAECVGVEPAPAGVRLRLACEDEPRSVEGSHLLLAVGRTPNTDDLGAGEAGLALDERGYVVVDERLATSVPGIWALGEVNGRGAFTHTAYDDHEIVAANLLDGGARSLSDRVPCYAVYTDPPLGRVGATEREAREGGRPLRVGTLPMSRVGRAREFGDTRGFMKVVVDAQTDAVLGASLLGMSGDEVVHCLVDLMAAGQPYTVISRAMHIHPTVAELLPTLLQDLGPPG